MAASAPTPPTLEGLAAHITELAQLYKHSQLQVADLNSRLMAADQQLKEAKSAAAAQAAQHDPGDTHSPRTTPSVFMRRTIRMQSANTLSRSAKNNRMSAFNAAS